MPTGATPGYGTLLKMGDGATPETFTTVAEVGDVEAPEISNNMEDASSQDSAGWEEYVPVYKSGGEPTFTINYRPTNATHDGTTGLEYVCKNQVKKNWQIVLPGAVKTFAFAAYVSRFKPKAPVKGLLRADITLKITGAIT
jgi:hypothetical protein